MTVQEKIAETTRITTAAEPSAIVAAAERAAQSAKSMDFRVKRLEDSHDNGGTFAVQTLFGAKQLIFGVEIGDAGSDGCRQVSTHIHDATTSQQKLFALIPVSPKNVVGLRNYRKFMANLEAEVARL
ncbi:MAG: hypothetical protein M9942_03230 [Microthrixaceae bacterium]|nr:hypothetical protein [Microthrixaceae bacterium]